MTVFWVVTPCSQVEVYWRLRGACCQHYLGDGWVGNLPDYKVQRPRKVTFILATVRTWNLTKYFFSDGCYFSKFRNNKVFWSSYEVRRSPFLLKLGEQTVVSHVILIAVSAKRCFSHSCLCFIELPSFLATFVVTWNKWCSSSLWIFLQSPVTSSLVDPYIFFSTDIKDSELGGACGTHGRGREIVQGFVGKAWWKETNQKTQS
jgi:hypothetical protein